MKNKIFFWIMGVFAVMPAITSCEKADSDKEWGLALIYMPQASQYSYLATLNGSDVTCEVDLVNNELRVYLSAYRPGLQALEEFSVDVVVDTPNLGNATELPASEYTLPSIVTCTAGERVAPFFLTVNLGFLKQNTGTDYTLTISIQNPDKYELNEALSTTNVLIKPSLLFN